MGEVASTTTRCLHEQTGTHMQAASSKHGAIRCPICLEKMTSRLSPLAAKRGLRAFPPVRAPKLLGELLKPAGVSMQAF